MSNLSELGFSRRPAAPSAAHTRPGWSSGQGQKSLVAAPRVLKEDPIIPARPPPEKEHKDIKPFYPAKAPREGGPNRGGYCFNKMPEYIEDPEEERMKARREEAKKVQAVGERPFKPSAINSSRPARTIVFHQAGVKM